MTNPTIKKILRKMHLMKKHKTYVLESQMAMLFAAAFRPPNPQEVADLIAEVAETERLRLQYAKMEKEREEELQRRINACR